jgi:hypothetical protein
VNPPKASDFIVAASQHAEISHWGRCGLFWLTNVALRVRAPPYKLFVDALVFEKGCEPPRFNGTFGYFWYWMGSNKLRVCGGGDDDDGAQGFDSDGGWND